MKYESESTVDQYLVKCVKKIKGLCVKFPVIYFLGFPDRMCLLPGGLIFFAEVKSTTGTPSPIQNKVIRKLRSLGFKVYIPNSKKAVDEIMEIECLN